MQDIKFSIYFGELFSIDYNSKENNTLFKIIKDKNNI